MTAQTLEQRAVLCSIFYAAGRSAEVSGSTYDHLKMDSLGCLVRDWVQTKTSKVKTVHDFVHREFYSICPLHALACYLFATCSKANNGNFLFPSMASIESSSQNARINTIIKDYYKHAPKNLDFPPTLTSRVFFPINNNIMLGIILCV